MWLNEVFGTQIKSLQPAIIIYSNKAGEFVFTFSTLDVRHIDGEQVALWNIHHSSGRQMTECLKYINWGINGNIPSLARQSSLSSWGPRRTPWFFCNFSTVWCGKLLKLRFLGFWNYNSAIQAFLASNILCLFISTEVSQ